jgi:KaiC/GvpD/RAD55 family RecA-like ATPase
MKSLDRVHSGITGLDAIIGGGIPAKDLILLSGECGSGKSILGLQFLIESRDSGVYVSFEDDISKITDTASVYGWDIKSLQRANKLRLLRYDPFKIEDIIEVIESNIREIGAKRVVLDSVSALGIYMKDASELRRMMLKIDAVLRKCGCTSILISEMVPGTKGISRFGVEEFVSDGVLVLRRYFIDGKYRRGLVVWKMRGSEHSHEIHSYDISNTGFSIGGVLDLKGGHAGQN